LRGMEGGPKVSARRVKPCVGVWIKGPNQLVNNVVCPKLDGVRVDTSSLSWFGQYKALLLVEGDETYITRT
jgi:hypothetical protein